MDREVVSRLLHYLADRYRVFRTEIGAGPASPAVCFVRHDVPLVADLASHPFLRESYDDVGRAALETSAAFEGADAFRLIDLDCHSALGQVESPQVLHATKAS